MSQLPRRGALLGSWWLLAHTLHAARVSRDVGSGRENYGAEHDLDARQDVALPFEEAFDVAMAVWVQTQVIRCLWSKMDAAPERPVASRLFDRVWNGLTGEEKVKKNLMQSVWELELNHFMQTTLKKSSLGSIKHAVLSAFRNTAAIDRVWLEEEGSIAEWKDALKAEYQFDYDATKQSCASQLERHFNNTKEMVDEELSGGCRGGCKAISTAMAGRCRETAEAFCPEGTACGCHAVNRAAVAAMMGTTVAGAVGGIVGLLSAGPLAPMAPLGAWGLAVLPIAAGADASGCRCLPSRCKWDRSKGACAPARASGANNPFQAVLPYVGMKCVAKPSGWRARFHLGHACEEAKPCTLDDAHKIGQVGNDTFNCKYMSAGRSTGTVFPPLRERLARYAQLFPGVAGAGGVRGAAAQ